jgi:pimeloyl-ACP methyl ester carboxylesterase/class 3 adenylate cyclase
MAQPTTRYARAGEVNIAYQVIGDGPVDLVWAWGLASNIEVAWEEPSYAAFLRRLSQFARLILFDRRGCGVSDREGTTVTPTLEERMDDVIAVLDAVRSQTASILGMSEGGCLAAALAATYPQRVSRIILYGTVARFRQDTDHRWGLADKAALADFVEWMRRGWGSTQAAENAVALWAPSMIGDQRFIAWFAKHCRHSVSRGAILPLLWSSASAYLVDVFAAVRVPTLVLHRRDDRLVPVGQGRRIAEQISNAQFVELPGADHFPFVGDAEAVLAEIEGFLLGSARSRRRQHRLLTVLCTDIAGCAESLNLTPDAWRELLAEYEEMVRNHLNRFGGEEVKRVGPGILAAFDGPSRAIRCAMSIRDAAARGGLAVRAGLHTGECEVVGSDVRGLAVHLATRIAEAGAPGQILVSSTVCDLVPGSGILFGDGQALDIEGEAGPRGVFPVLGHGATPDTVRRLAIDHANVLRRDGEYWTVAYGGLVVTLRDRKGLRDLARLLAAPGREFHVLDLATPAAARTAPSIRQALDAGMSIESGSTDPVIDDAARAAYQRRIAELRQDIEDAEIANDGEVVSMARQELDVLVEQLASAYGLGGRPRRTPDHVERARKAVTRRIRDAVARIDRAHPALGRHVHASVHTGVYCSYVPERDLVWTVDRGTELT